MRRPLSPFLGLALLVGAAGAQSGSPLPPAWKHWQFSAAVRGPESEPSGLWAVVIPSRVSAKSSRNWSDLRVMAADGAETPYVLHARTEKRSTVLRPGALFDYSFKPGANTQAIVDLGAQPGEHNSLVIETSETNYFTHVELAAGNDARDWRLVRDRVPIYRFATERLAGNQTVRYPTSRARYLRLRILQGDRQFPIGGVSVAQETVEEAETVALDVYFRRDPATPAQQTWWVADLGHGNDPVSSVRFSVEQAEFHRAVRVSTTEKPEDWRTWTTAGEGEIYRYRRDGQAHEKLSVALPETRARHWRVEIFNRNDAELAGLKVALHGTPRRVVFPARPGASYRLLYGNPAAQAASYEMARLTPAGQLASALPAVLGPEEANSAYEDPHPRPWTERNPVILWAAVLLAVAVLGTLAVRALRSA